MSEPKFDFVTEKVDHIRSSLPGIYFLIQDTKVLHIGESKDIRRAIIKHMKKGKEFNKVGIQFFEGDNKERKEFTQKLIQALKSNDNLPEKPPKKLPEKPAEKPKIAKKRQPRWRRKKEKPAKEISLPPKRFEQIRSSNNNGSVKLPPTTAEQIETLAEKGLGERTEIVPSAVEQLYQKKASQQSGSIDQIENLDQPAQTDDNNSQDLTPEAKDALAEWTRKVTKEAMSEISEELENTKSEDASLDLPDWLYQLADESVETPIPTNNKPKSEAPKKPKSGLPTWAQTDFEPSPDQPPVQTQNHQLEPREEEDETEIPEWLKDINYKKPSGNSPPPFG